MRCKWCGEDNIPWWRIFSLVPYDYCSTKCMIDSADHEAEVLRQTYEFINRVK